MGTIFSFFRNFLEFSFWIGPVGHRRGRYLQRDNNETMIILEELTPVEILHLIRPKGGLKFDPSSREVIFEDLGNCSQDDFNFIVNGFTDEVLLLLIKAGDNGLSLRDILCHSTNFALLARMITRLNFEDDSVSPESY